MLSSSIDRYVITMHKLISCKHANISRSSYMPHNISILRDKDNGRATTKCIITFIIERQKKHKVDVLTLDIIGIGKECCG